MNVDRQSYRNAMAQLGAAVNIITSDGPGGRHGMTASAVCSITDEPPTIAVCINRSSQSNNIFKENGVLCINTLSGHQEEISSVFAGSTKCEPQDRFHIGTWVHASTGAPVLKNAVVSFDCRITDIVEKGTHTIFFAEVESVKHGHEETEGLVYFRRSYHRIGVAQTLEALAA